MSISEHRRSGRGAFRRAITPKEPAPLQLKVAPVPARGAVGGANTAAMFWSGVELPHVPAGRYRAVCVAWQGPEWVNAFRRWSLRLEFVLLDSGVHVSLFLNFGSGQRPCVQGRQSKFYRTWSIVNGETPRKGQEMSLETFMEPGLIYLVTVEDSIDDGLGGEKPSALRYSKVREIISVERP